MVEMVAEMGMKSRTLMVEETLRTLEIMAVVAMVTFKSQLTRLKDVFDGL